MRLTFQLTNMDVSCKLHALSTSSSSSIPSLLRSSSSNLKRPEVSKRLAVAAPKAQFYLKPPPYPLDALEPFMSKKTLELHWGKHHRGYIEKLNKEIQRHDYYRYNLEELIKDSYNNGNPRPILNTAAEIWNHDFFWDTLRPGGGNAPRGQVLDRITKQFGSYQAFVDTFKGAATSLFGSGWVWLSVTKETKLVVERCHNAFNPLIWDHIPLLCLDVWEHAYYLDFQDGRESYIDTFFNKLINWEAVENRLNRAKGFIGLGEVVIPSVESIQEREKQSYYF